VRCSPQKKHISRYLIGALFAPVLLSLALSAHGAQSQRSKKAIAEFKRENPCPANGKKRSKCPGYMIDHIEPLCAGGADSASNMQWQTIEAAKEKDRDEKRHCAAKKKTANPSPAISPPPS